MFSSCLDKPAEIFDESLQGNSGSKVSSPKGMLAISIGEEIISFNWIGSFLFLNGSNILTGS